MGISYADLTISNPVQPELRPVQAKALADTGAVHLCIPQHIALQLSLDTREEREITLADGSKKRVPYVGPVGLQFANRKCFVGALVMGDEVLLGAIPMEDMDLLVVPMRREVIVNPASPNIPSAVAKGVRKVGWVGEA
jgi:clan AA aspartic protease